MQIRRSMKRHSIEKRKSFEDRNKKTSSHLSINLWNKMTNIFTREKHIFRCPNSLLLQSLDNFYLVKNFQITVSVNATEQTITYTREISVTLDISKGSRFKWNSFSAYFFNFFVHSAIPGLFFFSIHLRVY